MLRFNEAATKRSRKEAQKVYIINSPQRRFNEAATKRSRKDAESLRELHPGSRFNEAATKRSRKDVPFDLINDWTEAASMRPRPKDRGKQARVDQTVPIYLPASMRPRPKDRGKGNYSGCSSRKWRRFNEAATKRSRKAHPVAWARDTSGAASMRPRPKDRGKWVGWIPVPAVGVLQ